MKFTFTNISNTLSIDSVENVLNTKPNTNISPELKMRPLSYIEPYYRDNMMKSNNLNGVLIKLPIFSGGYLTLNPEETIIIETKTAEEEDFYKEVVNTFTDDEHYPILHCETGGGGQSYETWGDLTDLTWGDLISFTWGDLGKSA